MRRRVQELESQQVRGRVRQYDRVSEVSGNGSRFSRMLRVMVPVCAALTLVSARVSADDKYALLIGVTTYKNAPMNRTELQFPEADAEAIGDLLKESGYAVKTLLGEKATRATIAAELEALKKQGSNDGVVLVGVFGHGVQYDKDAYFGGWDTRIRIVKDEQGRTVRLKNGQPMVEPDPESMTSMRSILDALTVCGAKNRVLLADCCRDDPSRARSRAFGSTLTTAELPAGTAALFACSAKERAWEHEDWGHGAFTHALLECLRDATPDLTANGLSARLHRRVRMMVKETANEEQTVNPLISGVVELRLAAHTVRNSLGMEFVRIPGGRHQMYDVTPLEDVKSLYVSQHKVTVGDFKQFVATTGYQTVAELAALNDRGALRKRGYEFEADTPTTRRLCGLGLLPGQKTLVRDKRFSWKHPGWAQSDHHPVINLAGPDIFAFVEWVATKNPGTRLPSEVEHSWFRYRPLPPDSDDRPGPRSQRQSTAIQEWLVLKPISLTDSEISHITTTSRWKALGASELGDLFTNARELQENSLAKEYLCAPVDGPIQQYSCYVRRETSPLPAGFRLVMPTAP